MKTIIKTTILVLGMSAISINSFAATETVSTKATAVLAAACTINAQSVSFGALALPIYAQSATSNINVLCSKEAAYKIDLSYGLSSNYWRVTNSGGLWADSRWDATVSLVDSTGKVIRNSWFTYPAGHHNLQKAMVEALGCTVAADGKCYAPISPTDTSGSAGNGMMYGAKGDSVAYNISVPGDTSKIWNIGKNSYNSIGTGISQSVPVQAQLIPSGSTAYPTPDMYSDTVIATVTY